MSALPYMPLYVADYLADAAHLTTEEHGAYLLLIMTYWQRGKALPAEATKLARIARLPDERWTDVEQTLSEFFTLIDGRWHHKRIDAELYKVRVKSEKAKRAGFSSARARKATDAQRTLNGRSTDADQTLNHTDTDTDTDTEIDTRVDKYIEVETEVKRKVEGRAIAPGHSPSSTRGARIPPGFQPSPDVTGMAMDRGLTEPEIIDQLERFRDWANSATGQVRLKRDWNAAFRNWIKRVADDKRRKTATAFTARPSPAQAMRDAFDDLDSHIAGRRQPAG